MHSISHLPDAILIRPLVVPVHATISVPGSKSLTNRALILAVLSKEYTRLNGALWAEDTELMVAALQKLGFQIDVKMDPSNTCNRAVIVHGKGGEISIKEAELYVGTAGTVARFLAAFCALGNGRYRLYGTDRMHQRPMKEVFRAIRSLGGRVEDSNDRLPAIISGPIHPGRVSVSDSDSSQFASALLLISKVIKITVDCSSSPYVAMTRQLLNEWETASATRDIEPDASSASYFVALHRIHSEGELHVERFESKKSSQIDFQISEDRFWKPFPKQVSRKSDLGDSVLTLVIAAAALKQPFQLVEAAKLRDQECDRISALARELTKCGVPVKEFDEGLSLEPATQFKKATIHTYNDHRIAMSFAVLGTVDVMKDGQPWVTIENPSCVSKTFPNFFETLEETAKQSYEKAGKPYLPIVLKTDGKPVFK